MGSVTFNLNLDVCLSALMLVVLGGAIVGFLCVRRSAQFMHVTWRHALMLYVAPPDTSGFPPSDEG